MPKGNGLRNFAVSCAIKYYNFVDPLLQRRSLKNYDNDIKTITPGSRRYDSGKYAVFVYYETNGDVSKSVKNIIEALLRRNSNIIVVTNIDLSDRQLNWLKESSHTIIYRGNQGYDFGAYKDCINYLRDTAPDLERVTLLNDSVYYFSNGIDSFSEGLEGDEDCIAAFENWDPIHAYHLQSFALSISARVFNHPLFKNFWDSYVPVNNRLHAINSGEKKLSEVCLRASNSTRIVYSTEHAIKAVTAGVKELKPFEFYISSPIEIRADKSFVLSSNTPKGGRYENPAVESMKMLTSIDSIYRGSPIHAGMMHFVWYTDCPIVKKDVVYRQQYRFWEVEYVLRKRFDQKEVEEYLTMVRKKGTLAALSPLKRLKSKIGAA